MFPSREIVNELREEYPAGTRVRLLEMDDEQAPPIGTLGTVRIVDDAGTVFVDWDTGSGLGVAYEYDRIEVVS